MYSSQWYALPLPWSVGDGRFARNKYLFYFQKFQSLFCFFQHPFYIFLFFCCCLLLYVSSFQLHSTDTVLFCFFETDNTSHTQVQYNAQRTTHIHISCPFQSTVLPFIFADWYAVIMHVHNSTIQCVLQDSFSSVPILIYGKLML